MKKGTVRYVQEWQMGENLFVNGTVSDRGRFMFLEKNKQKKSAAAWPRKSHSRGKEHTHNLSALQTYNVLMSSIEHSAKPLSLQIRELRHWAGSSTMIQRSTCCFNEVAMGCYFDVYCQVNAA